MVQMDLAQFLAPFEHQKRKKKENTYELVLLPVKLILAEVLKSFREKRAAKLTKPTAD